MIRALPFAAAVLAICAPSGSPAQAQTDSASASQDTLQSRIDIAWAALERKDFETAYPLFLALAEQGNASAQTNLGWMYDNGQGVPQDYAEAMRWYRKAVEQGEAVAQTNLGWMYYKGAGVPQDYAEAVRWSRKAAEQGEAGAQFNLGWMYTNGHGVPQDYVKAYMWLNLAAAQGNALAQTNKSIVSKRMTPADISRAQRLSSECLARNYKGC